MAELFIPIQKIILDSLTKLLVIPLPGLNTMLKGHLQKEISKDKK